MAITWGRNAGRDGFGDVIDRKVMTATKTTKDGYTVGSPLTVSAASYDPGYSLDTVLSDCGTRYLDEAELIKGFISEGVAIGEDMPRGMIPARGIGNPGQKG